VRYGYDESLCPQPAGYPGIMRDGDPYPRPVSDPEIAGIPEYADDDSTAYDDVDSPREADGPDPASLPRDRDEGPAVLDDVGTTPAEQLRGESLDRRLAREEPDVGAQVTEPALTAEPALTDDAPVDPDVESPLLGDDGPVDPHLDSQVSMYERMGADPMTGGRVGRLVEPDEGAHPDEERDAIARDAGAAGGAPTAEEAAMHEVRPPE
jgi:hypothetical protein